MDVWIISMVDEHQIRGNLAVALTLEDAKRWCAEQYPAFELPWKQYVLRHIADTKDPKWRVSVTFFIDPFPVIEFTATKGDSYDNA